MAISDSTFSNAGGAVSDLFGGIGAIQGADIKAQGLRIKAHGDLAEASNYELAAGLARKEEDFTVQSTAIQAMQADRKLFSNMGGISADVAGAGFSSGGSSLDLLRDSASQGALAKGVLQEQGYITEQGYEEQAKSYDTMAAAGRAAAAGEEDIANKTQTMGGVSAAGDFIGTALKLAPLLLL